MQFSRKKMVVPADPFPVGLETLEVRCLLSALGDIQARPMSQLVQPSATSAIDGYSPQEIRNAYGFNQIALPSGGAATGAGQTIAIVTAFNDPTIASDLSVFDKQFGLSNPPSFKVVNQTGGSASSLAVDGGWSTETALDVEWAHSAAPGANILLVEAASDTMSNLLAAVNYARNAPGVSVVSMSWGSGEFLRQYRYDRNFTTPAGHQGVTFVAASGDQGSWWGPSWPSTSPNVLSVGGTQLNINASQHVTSETGWDGSGGGLSWYSLEPSYQSVAQNSGWRSAPDVSYNASPNTGFAIYSSVSDQGYTGWSVVGGTSGGTPQWAGLIAVANQVRAAKGLGSLDGATQTLPLLYSTYRNSKTYAAAFNDVTQGATSDFAFASAGYDQVTGLGSPKAAGVVQVLSGSGASSSVKHAARTRTARAVAIHAVKPAVETESDSSSTSAPTSSPPTSTTTPTTTSTPVSSAPAFINAFASNIPVAAPQSTSGVGSINTTTSSIGSPVSQTVQSNTTVALADAAKVFASRPISFASLFVAGETVESMHMPDDFVARLPVAQAMLDSSSTAMAALANIASTPREFHFASLDVLGTFGDAMSMLADEATTESIRMIPISTIVGSTRAWTITAGVIAADLTILGYVCWRRSQKKRQATSASAHEQPLAPE